MSADVDFDQLEAVLENQNQHSLSDDRTSTLKKERNGSRERSHGRKATEQRTRKDPNERDQIRKKSRDRDDGRGNGYRERSRSRDHRRYRSRSKDRSSSHKRGYKHSRSPPADRRQVDEVRIASMKAREEQRRKNEQERQMREEEEKMKREIDEARRDDLTVLVMNLSLKASERDIWKFFSEKCGKVRDIQIIRDARSGKSKGVGYVEFYTPTSVMTALAMSGQIISDQPIVIQASQAEKNRAAKAAKQQQAELTEHGPMKIYVGGLVENLSALEESDLRQLFSPFGDIVSVDLHKDPYTGRGKGYAFIHFRNAQDAREAMTAMNGFEIGGRQIKVGYATDNAAMPRPVDGINAFQTALQLAEAATDNERLDDEGGGLLSGVNPRISLMQKLQRTDPASQQQAQMGTTAATTMPTVNPISPNIVLEPLFSAEDVAQEGASLLDDIEEDVRTECSRFGMVLNVFINRKTLDKKVWVKFAAMDMAVKAHQGMSGRYFAGNPIQVTFVPDHIWNACCYQQHL